MEDETPMSLRYGFRNRTREVRDERISRKMERCIKKKAKAPPAMFADESIINPTSLYVPRAKETTVILADEHVIKPIAPVAQYDMSLYVPLSEFDELKTKHEQICMALSYDLEMHKVSLIKTTELLRAQEVLTKSEEEKVANIKKDVSILINDMNRAMLHPYKCSVPSFDYINKYAWTICNFLGIECIIDALGILRIKAGQPLVSKHAQQVVISHAISMVFKTHPDKITQYGGNVAANRNEMTKINAHAMFVLKMCRDECKWRRYCQLISDPHIPHGGLNTDVTALEAYLEHRCNEYIPTARYTRHFSQLPPNPAYPSVRTLDE